MTLKTSNVILVATMGSTRNHVLQQLLTKQRCTINDLAEAVRIDPISVRHHIVKLEGEGLVDSTAERHGVGRPRRVYFLTEAGMEQLKSQLPSDAYENLFDKLAWIHNCLRRRCCFSRQPQKLLFHLSLDQGLFPLR